MSSYEFRDHYGYRVTVAPARIPSPSQHMPAVTISPEIGNIIWVPLDRVEEVVAGLRDMARQAGGQAGAQPAESQPVSSLPQLLAATLTERFTALGNPFSRMSINFQGPDGWPASRDVSPNDVADVLKELLDQASGPPGAAFSVAERQFLTFALDLAADRMANEDGFTDEDQAALDRFRSMSTGEARGPAPERIVVRLDTSGTDFKDLIRRIVGNGPTGGVG